MSNHSGSPKEFCVMVLEDESASLAAVVRILRNECPDAIVITARTLSEAKVLLGKYPFDLFVLDIQLPDGSGIDFLHDVQSTQPEASAVVVTGVPLPEYRDQAMAFGVLHFMEKPVNPRTMGLLVRNLRNPPAPPPPAKADTSFFSASLTRLTTTDLIQLKCLGRATLALHFISKDQKNGRIFFKEGEVIHAETDDSTGVDAFNQIVSWRSGKASEMTNLPEPMRSIEENWQGLVLNAVQWCDEQDAAKANLR